jgi:hypothetical protein
VTSMTTTAQLVPNGALVIEFNDSSALSKALNTPLTIFRFTSMAATRSGTVQFSSISAIDTASEQTLCASSEYTPTSILVTISTCNQGLSRGAMIGIAG